MLALSTANILGGFSGLIVDPKLLTEVMLGLPPPEGSCLPAGVEEFLV